MNENYPKTKRTTTRRALIFTENDTHTKKDADYLGIPSLTKGSSVPYKRSKVVEIPVSFHSSGAFLDFNSEWSNNKFKEHHNKHQLLSHYGNGGHGYYRHNKEAMEKIKLKKPKMLRFKTLNYVDTIKEEQRTTQGAEICGKERLSHERALAEMRRTMIKRNRGGRSGKEGGAYQGGHKYNTYNEQIVRKDNEFKKLNEKQEEFRSIVEGQEQGENYGSTNLAKGFI